MPSKKDDSPGTTPVASPGFSPPENCVPDAVRPDPNRWLADYIAVRIREAGVNDIVAGYMGERMSDEISAAFSTIARLESAGVHLPLGRA